MIIIPEIKTVFIRIPKTASTSISHAIEHKYRDSFSPYRHMESMGIPAGYEKWRKVAVIRNPLHRLRSLYSFCRNAEQLPRYGVGWAATQKAATDVSFERWLLNNTVPFCSPVDLDGNFNPYYFTRSTLAENVKSQSVYVDDDTDLYSFEDLELAAKSMDIDEPLEKLRESSLVSMTSTSDAIFEHIEKHMMWDISTHQRLNYRR
jgi:hypothetical protein